MLDDKAAGAGAAAPPDADALVRVSTRGPAGVGEDKFWVWVIRVSRVGDTFPFLLAAGAAAGTLLDRLWAAIGCGAVGAWLSAAPRAKLDSPAPPLPFAACGALSAGDPASLSYSSSTRRPAASGGVTDRAEDSDDVLDSESAEFARVLFRAGVSSPSSARVLFRAEELPLTPLVLELILAAEAERRAGVGLGSWLDFCLLLGRGLGSASLPWILTYFEMSSLTSLP